MEDIQENKKLLLGSQIWTNELFQEEYQLAVKDLYAECIDKIKQKDYPSADSLNSAVEILNHFFDRFRAYAERYAEHNGAEEPDLIEDDL